MLKHYRLSDYKANWCYGYVYLIIAVSGSGRGFYGKNWMPIVSIWIYFLTGGSNRQRIRVLIRPVK